MKGRSIGEPLGALMIVLPGGVAAYVVARTLAAYWGRDYLASLIVVAIGAALALGLIELVARLLRATQLERELRALPATPDERTIDAASPLLSSMLRARLEQAPLPSLSEGIAPFLTGLLVMLGLLGTLLGLFQTVHGAGHALTSSADIDALRQSLSAPIDGLTRSFGCSAAGISASAMLGLAVALVRRREVRALRKFHGYAAGPLRALSPVQRQLRAIERLADQGIALPDAASAIERVGSQLGELSQQLVSLQEKAIKAQQRAFSDLLASVRGEFSKAAGETGEALHARVSPLLEQMATRSGEALVAQAGALADVARDVTRELERDAVARREHAAAAVQALQTRLDDAERARAEAHAQELALVSAQAARAVSDGERRERALSERWEQLLTRFDAQFEAARASEQQRLGSLDDAVSAARERDAEQRARLDGLSARVGSELERLSGALSTQLEQRVAVEHQQAQQVERVLLQLSAAADTLADGAVRQTHALEQSVSQQAAALAQQGELLEHSTTRQERGLADSAARLQSALEESSAHQRSALEESSAHQRSALEESSARQQALLEQSVARHMGALEDSVTRQSALLEHMAASQADLTARSVEQQARTLTQLVEHVPALLDTAAEDAQRAAQTRIAELVAATDRQLTQISSLLADESSQRAESTRAIDRRAALSLERVEASAALLDGAITRQSDGLERLVARMSALLPELTEAAQAGAVTTLARLNESTAAQATRFSELEATLERGREQHVAELADRLSQHAVDLEQRLAKTSAAVHEAAAVWQASSAEMQAVAEMFAASIERQREASDAWLESLGHIEGAVERAGRDAARDALGDQLAATQEVFARQLQFQRELFDQLRGLRAGAPHGSNGAAVAALHGEHDVSV